MPVTTSGLEDLLEIWLSWNRNREENVNQSIPDRMWYWPVTDAAGILRFLGFASCNPTFGLFSWHASGS